MGTSGNVDALVKLVSGRLVKTMSASGRNHPAPISMQSLLQQLKFHINNSNVFAVACDCALLGELIFASGRGGIYKLKAARVGSEEMRKHEPLCALRNVCFHPGNLGADATMPALVEAVRATGEFNLYERLATDWSLLATDLDLGRWALQQLNAVGRYELQAIGRWSPPNPKR